MYTDGGSSLIDSPRFRTDPSLASRVGVQPGPWRFKCDSFGLDRRYTQAVRPRLRPHGW
jgi:hypothetical protein